MSITFRFIKESNGNVVVRRYKGSVMDFVYSIQPDKDLRINQNKIDQISVPIYNTGGLTGGELLMIPWTQVDLPNSVPSSSAQSSIQDTINVLAEDFFFANAGGGGGGAVSSVNGQTGVVVLDADDIDDTSTAHKFVTATDLTNLSNLSGTNTGDVTITDTDTVDLTLTGQALSADVITQMSIISDASGVKLDGDAASPGNSLYYGTNAGGTKGFHALPGGGGTLLKMVTTGNESNSVNTLATMSGLTVTLQPGRYRIEYDISLDINNTGGLRVNVVFSGTATGKYAAFFLTTNTSTQQWIARDIGTEVPITYNVFTATNSNGRITADITVTVAGDLNFQYRPFVNTQTVTINQVGTSVIVLEP